MWSVERDESGPTGTARVLYMKDGEDGLSWSAGRSCAGCLSEPDRAVARGEMIAEGTA